MIDFGETTFFMCDIDAAKVNMHKENDFFFLKYFFFFCGD